MTHGHSLDLRCFLEGIEIPVIGANVTVVANTPVTAQIQVIGTDRLLTIPPRTVVHLFFYDFVDAANPLSQEDIKNAGLDPADQELSKYRLLFMGEVQGIAFQKSAAERAAVLNCVDFSNYWDTTYQYNFGGSLFGGRQQAAFIGANTNLLTSPLGHGVGTFAALLQGKSANFPRMKGLLAGVVRCLEAIGGCYYGKDTFRGANDFTSLAELRLKILQQIAAAELDSSTARLFARKAFNMWMNQQMQGLGKLVTFRGVTQILNQFIFHEIYPNPCARYIPDQQTQQQQAYYADAATDPRFRGIYDSYRKLIKLLTSAKKNLSPIAITEAEIKAASADLSQAGRVMGSLIANEASRFTSGVGAQMISLSPDAELTQIRKALGGSSQINPVNVSTALDVKARRAAMGFIDTAIKNLQSAVSGKTVKKQKTVTVTQRSRVNNQILRPDIWFVPPPRCNVLFPEMYESFQWQRNFLREISRMELQTTHEILGDDALFNGRYYAPDVADMRKGVKLSTRQFSKMTLNHELYTGIIPMYEKLSEANLYAMGSKQVKMGGAKVGYAQRSVNFMYFKHRFASRQMMAGGRFNPWFVAGFPSLLIDKPMDAVNLAIAGLPVADQMKVLDFQPDNPAEITRAVLLQKLVPTQYMGMCAQLTHMLSQQGGRTEYAFTQARIHREDTEFLGVDKATVNKKVGTGSRTYVCCAVASKPPQKGSRGRFGGAITGVKDVSAAYKGRYIPGLYDKRKYLGTGPTSMATQQLSPEYYPVDGTNVVALEVKESFDRRARVKINLPIEDAIRPPWIWDGWNNLKIGDTYLQFFGTNSITDIEGFTATGTAAINAIGSGLAEDYGMVIESSQGVAQGSGVNPLTAPQTPLTPFAGATPNYSAPTYGLGAPSTPNQRPPSNSLSAYDQKISAATILAIEKERTIENAVDYLVRLYSYLKANSLDVGQFLRNYSWRPVATLVDILGSTKFSIKEDPPGSGTFVTSGQEGFHSRAFSDESNLFGLVDPQVGNILGLKKPKTGTDMRTTAVAKLDVRGARRKVVREYVNELTNSRGLLG